MVILVGGIGGYGIGVFEALFVEGRNPHPNFQDLRFAGRRPQGCHSLPTNNPPNFRSPGSPGCLLTPPSGGADPRELVEPKEGGEDGWLGLATVLVECSPIMDRASHIESMVFIIRLKVNTQALF